MSRYISETVQDMDSYCGAQIGTRRLGLCALSLDAISGDVRWYYLSAHWLCGDVLPLSSLQAVSNWNFFTI